jgi:hypothetical protein
VVKVYAISLVLGFLALLGWMFSIYLGGERPGWDPDRRFGLRGRRLVAAMVGFGIAGMSAEFSPRALAWPVSLVLALLGALAAALYAHWLARHEAAESSSSER